jgi:hypothetical protein
MNDSTSDRRAELIAGALSGDLDPSEQEEFDAMRRVDPTIDAESGELDRLLRAMPRDLDWDDAPPGAALRDRIAAIEHESAGGIAPLADPADPVLPTESARRAGGHLRSVGGARPSAEPGRRRRAWLLPVTAAACLALGLGVGVAVGGGVDVPDGNVAASPSSRPVGPPGTLGALEQVDFAGEPSGVQVDGSLVAHTWGTEALLRIDGLPVGDSYTVIVVSRDGTRSEAGSFLGSELTVDCRMNAAVYRQEAVAVEIDGADGVRIATAELPEAS